MKKPFLFIALACALSAGAAVPRMAIYRNDGDFNIFEIGRNTAYDFTHDLYAEPAVSYTLSDDSKLKINLEAVDSCRMIYSDIPDLYFEFVDYPDATTLWDKELYLSSRLSIDGNGMYDDVDGLSLSVKGRGNSTWHAPKKPMRLKFSKKTSLFGFKKAKSYVLLANYLDDSLMRNALTLKMAEMLKMPYANHTVPCNVYVNGHPQGTYLLTEKVGINSGSVDIDENTGILFEISAEFDEPYEFKSPNYNLPVMVKDPDFDELYDDDPDGLAPADRLALWQKDFNLAEQAVKDGHGFDKFDIDSFVDFILINNFNANCELYHPKSVYVYKETIGDDYKYKFGPVWDFDIAYNRPVPLKNDPDSYARASYYTVLNPHSFIKALIKTEGFKEAYQKRFTQFETEIYPELMDWFDNYQKLIEPSAKVNGLLWPETVNYRGWGYVLPSFEHETICKNFRTWIEKRMNYLHKQNNTGQLL